MKRMIRRSVLTAMLSALATSTALAQEKGQVGVTIAYPASAGLIWHATDRIALRGTVEFTHASTETDYGSDPFLDYPGLPLPTLPSFTAESSSTVWSFSFAGLFYLSHADGVSPYLSPRYSINRASASSSFDFGSVLPISIGQDNLEQTRTDDAFGGFFGVQYAPNRRFSMFAEVGIEYHSADDNSDITIGRVDASATAMRAGVGAILYLGK